MSHLKYRMLYSVASLSSTSKMYSLTSARARLRISWLRSSLRGRSGEVDHPIGMRAVQVAIGIHHLGLHPQAEIHAQAR